MQYRRGESVGGGSVQYIMSQYRGSVQLLLINSSAISEPFDFIFTVMFSCHLLLKGLMQHFSAKFYFLCGLKCFCSGFTLDVCTVAVPQQSASTTDCTDKGNYHRERKRKSITVMGRDQGVVIKVGVWGLVVYWQNSNPFPNKCTNEISSDCSESRSCWTVTFVHKQDGCHPLMSQPVSCC